MKPRTLILTMLLAALLLTGCQGQNNQMPSGSEPTQAVTAQPAPEEVVSSSTGTVIVEEGLPGTYIRRGPSLMEERLALLANALQVTVTGVSPSGDWWQINTEELEGWISANNLVVADPSAVPCISMNNGACPP